MRGQLVSGTVSSECKVSEARTRSACSRNGQSLLWLEQGSKGQEAAIGYSVGNAFRGVIGWI